MEFIKPKKLVSGKSVVGLIAPSGVVDKKELDKGVQILKDWGFEVKLGKNVLAQNKDFSAGGGEERFADFLEMVEDRKVGAIGCIVGGYAAAEILKFFTPEICRQLVINQKLFFGYSDFSLILNVLFCNQMIGFHAPNVGGLYQRSLNTQKSLYLSLIGEVPSEIGPWFGWKTIKRGFARGRLLVSNLEALINSLGTVFDPLASCEEGLVLALEETGEDKSTMYRWLQKLAAHCSAGRIKGIILGRFVKIGEKGYPLWGKEIGVEQIFLETFGSKKIPIASWPEFGHVEEEKSRLFAFRQSKARERVDFWSLPSGIEVLFSVKKETCRLKFLERPVL